MTSKKNNQTKRSMPSQNKNYGKKSEGVNPRFKKTNANHRPARYDADNYDVSGRWTLVDWIVFSACALITLVVISGACIIWIKEIFSDSLISLIVGVTSIILAIWSIYFSWRSNHKTSLTLTRIQINVDNLIDANSQLSNTMSTWQRTMDLQFAKQSVKSIDTSKSVYDLDTSSLLEAVVLYACKKVQENKFFISYNEIHPTIASFAFQFLNKLQTSAHPSIFECQINNRGIMSVNTFDKDYFKNIDQYKITNLAKRNDVSPNIRSIVNESIAKINDYYSK